MISFSTPASGDKFTPKKGTRLDSHLAHSDETKGEKYPRTDPHTRVLLAVGAVALFIGGGLFLKIAEDVATGDLLIVMDARVANRLHAHASPGPSLADWNSTRVSKR